MERIPVAGPSITQREIDYVTDAVTRCWYSEHNYYHAKFEAEAKSYFGRKYAVALPSCTSALHLSLAALGIGPGDEVIVPDLTWIASAAPVSYVGARPVFADVDPRNWCISAETLQACMTKATRAVIVVDLYGNMPDMQPILEVARQHEIAVIEDAAEAIGSEYNGHMAGSFGISSCISFHGSKTLTTGEGGMLLTDNDAFHAKVQHLRDHGREPGDTNFFNTAVGFKYKMSSMQAALGLAQMERAPELIEMKRQIFRWYQERLSGIPGLTLNPEPAGVRNSYWMVTAIFDEQYRLRKHKIKEALSARGIDTRPFFHPLSSLPAYRDTFPGRRGQLHNEHAYNISPNGINLPSGYNLTESHVDHVCHELKSLLGLNRQRMAA
jgi:perosamine synthetase